MLSTKYKLFAICTDNVKPVGELERGQKFLQIILRTSSVPEQQINVDEVFFVHSAWQVDENFIMVGRVGLESRGGEIRMRSDEKVVVLSI